MSGNLLLDGKKILITRPPGQAEELNEKLTAMGAECHCLGLFEIQPLAYELSASLDHYDGLIYTSRNAVVYGPLPEDHNTLCYAIGPGTAAELAQRGYRQVFFPHDTRSEGLLSLPGLHQVKDKRWLIIKGRGGRDFLPRQLTDRGARVESLAVYFRQPLTPDTTRVAHILSQVDLVLVFSGEGLNQLFSLCPAELRERLLSLQLVVPSVRVVKMAMELGFTLGPQVTGGMSEQAMITALLNTAACSERGIHDTSKTIDHD